MVLYKSRMADSVQLFRNRFFDSLDEVTQFLRLFDFLPNVYLYVKDREGRFVAMNETRVRMSGVQTEADLLGKTDLDLHSDHWGKLYQQEDRRVMESGNELPNQIWLVSTGNGKLGTFCSSKIPVRGRDGEIIGIAGVMYRVDQERADAARDDPAHTASTWMINHYSERITVEEVAEHVGLSTSQLNRRFHASYQMPPSEYLQRVRIHEASRLLADLDGPVGEIAISVGFYDQAHFTRTFRRFVGMTPLEFRKLSQNERSV